VEREREKRERERRRRRRRREKSERRAHIHAIGPFILLQSLFLMDGNEKAQDNMQSKLRQIQSSQF